MFCGLIARSLNSSMFFAEIEHTFTLSRTGRRSPTRRDQPGKRPFFRNSVSKTILPAHTHFLQSDQQLNMRAGTLQDVHTSRA